MKIFRTSLVAFLILATFVGAGTIGQTERTKHTMQTQSELDALSRSLGINIGQSLKTSGIEQLNIDQFAEGLKHSMNGNPTEEELQMAQANINSYLQTQAELKAAADALEAKKIGEAFLAENAKKEGVVTLPSGLQYKIIKAGAGPKAIDGDQVTTHYTGKFIDGKVFDSSVERGTPATFGVNQVIKGWTEALKLMPEGSKWELYIPYNLAYGESGRPPQIPAYSVLVFELDLIDVVGK
ncbi:MAG: FKBP-type peptidyl-prolyl cis-trans isomerase FklB [Bacteroidia bacterium]|jgi:FKBP-type peptidyl-prolyl cis-trans isomerase FklB